MKRQLLTMLVLWIPALLISQNPLCRPFGSSQDEVSQFLSANKYKFFETEENQMVATTSGFKITYYFFAEKLYKTEIISNYADDKSAQTAMSSLYEYYKLIQSEFISVDMGKKAPENFSARKKTELVIVTNNHVSKGSSAITINAISNDYCPIAERSQADETSVILVSMAK